MQDISKSHRFIYRLIARHKTRTLLRIALVFAKIIDKGEEEKEIALAFKKIAETYIKLMILDADVFSKDVALMMLWDLFISKHQSSHQMYRLQT